MSLNLRPFCLDIANTRVYNYYLISCLDTRGDREEVVLSAVMRRAPCVRAGDRALREEARYPGPCRQGSVLGDKQWECGRSWVTGWGMYWAFPCMTYLEQNFSLGRRKLEVRAMGMQRGGYN